MDRNNFIKRTFDLSISILFILIISPILVFFILIIYLKDFSNPLYISNRVGINDKEFKMIKLRSMIISADQSDVDSTSANDARITSIGMIVRKYKIDELSQFLNVILGNMSLVGPRPNVRRETNLYSSEERFILKIKPGITDFSSIVFSDEAQILEGYNDPDLAYNQLIRPWKSRLALIYVKESSLTLDIKILFFTFISLISRNLSIKLILGELRRMNVSKEILTVCSRKNKLVPHNPPGLNDIVRSRNIG